MELSYRLFDVKKKTVLIFLFDAVSDFILILQVRFFSHKALINTTFSVYLIGLSLIKLKI